MEDVINYIFKDMHYTANYSNLISFSMIGTGIIAFITIFTFEKGKLFERKIDFFYISLIIPLTILTIYSNHQIQEHKINNYQRFITNIQNNENMIIDDINQIIEKDDSDTPKVVLIERYFRNIEKIARDDYNVSIGTKESEWLRKSIIPSLQSKDAKELKKHTLNQND